MKTISAGVLGYSYQWSWLHVNKHPCFYCGSVPTGSQKWGRLFNCHGQTGQTKHVNDFLLFLLQLLHLKRTHRESWFSLLHSTYGPRSFTKLYRWAQNSIPLLSSPHLIKQWVSSHSQRLGIVWRKSICQFLWAGEQGNLKPLFGFNTNLPVKSHIEWDQCFLLSNSKWTANMYSAAQLNASTRQWGLFNVQHFRWLRLSID